MAKDSVSYACRECGVHAPKWVGRCTACDAWGSLEALAATAARARPRGDRSAKTVALSVAEVPTDNVYRVGTGIGELDRVLGGGAVPGGAVLVGGDPGVGKSTLLLQALGACARTGPALYVSGEESAAQVALRARRLGLGDTTLKVLGVSELSEIEAAAASVRPLAMVVDSVQAVRDASLGSPAGTVTQLREVTMRLVDLAQREGTALFLVGHVTKEGGLAGPKVLEHLVDAVLAFEGERGHAFRTLRATKNRFGSATEVGLFEMTQEGLREVQQPSAMFLAERPRGASGSVVAATAEGARSLLVEVQALVGHPGVGAARRSATGVDGGRLAMLLAVLQRRTTVELGQADVFVNVAGGLHVDEPAVDLAVALAVASAFLARPTADELVAFGEVGLAGEVRGVPRVAARLAEARAMGFQRVLLPASSAQRTTSGEREGVEVVPVRTVEEAIDKMG